MAIDYFRTYNSFDLGVYTCWWCRNSCCKGCFNNKIYIDSGNIVGNTVNRVEVKDGVATIVVPGAESFEITGTKGVNTLKVVVAYEGDKKDVTYEVTVPSSYATAGDPVAVYRRGVLTLTWNKPETVSIEVEFQE